MCSVGSGMVGPSLKGHTGTIRSVAFQDKNGRDNAAVLASAGAGDNRPRLWDVTTGDILMDCVKRDLLYMHSAFTDSFHLICCIFSK